MAVHKRLLCYAVFAVGLLCMILACGDDEGALTATALSNGIWLENGTGHNVGFLLVEQETSAVVNLALVCAGSNELASGGTTVVDSSDIEGYGPGKTISVCYWRCPKSSSDEMHSTSVVAEQ